MQAWPVRPCKWWTKFCLGPQCYGNFTFASSSWPLVGKRCPRDSSSIRRTLLSHNNHNLVSFTLTHHCIRFLTVDSVHLDTPLLSSTARFLDILSQFGVSWHVPKPTNTLGDWLDGVITSDDCTIEDLPSPIMDSSSLAYVPLFSAGLHVYPQTLTWLKDDDLRSSPVCWNLSSLSYPLYHLTILPLIRLIDSPSTPSQLRLLYAGVGAATDSRQLLDSRAHGDCSHPGRTYSRVRYTRTLEYILP